MTVVYTVHLQHPTIQHSWLLSIQNTCNILPQSTHNCCGYSTSAISSYRYSTSAVLYQRAFMAVFYTVHLQYPPTEQSWLLSIQYICGTLPNSTHGCCLYSTSAMSYHRALMTVVYTVHLWCPSIQHSWLLSIQYICCTLPYHRTLTTVVYTVHLQYPTLLHSTHDCCLYITSVVPFHGALMTVIYTVQKLRKKKPNYLFTEILTVQEDLKRYCDRNKGQPLLFSLSLSLLFTAKEAWNESSWQQMF